MQGKKRPYKGKTHLAQKPEMQGKPEEFENLCQMHLSQQNHLAQIPLDFGSFIVNDIRGLEGKRVRFGFVCQMTDKNRKLEGLGFCMNSVKCMASVPDQPSGTGIWHRNDSSRGNRISRVLMVDK